LLSKLVTMGTHKEHHENSINNLFIVIMKFQKNCTWCVFVS